MNFLIVISVLVCASQVYGDCPKKEELHCNFYDTTSCPAGSSVRNTYIRVGNKNCDACRICFPDSAKYGCPAEPCPYTNIRDKYPMDCGIKMYIQKTWIDGRSCGACATFTKDCSNLSWIG